MRQLATMRVSRSHGEANGKKQKVMKQFCASWSRPTWGYFKIVLLCLSWILSSCSPKFEMDGDPAPPQVIEQDLQVTQCDLLGSVVAQGQAIPFSIVVAGTGLSVRDVSLSLYISNSPNFSAASTLAGYFRVPSGPFLSYYNWNPSVDTSSLQLAPGTYYFACVADELNQVAETNEGNNYRLASGTCQVTPVGLPDLADGGSLYWSLSPSSIAQPGNSVSVGFQVINGTQTASGSFLVRIYASLDTAIGSPGDILVSEFSVAGIGGYGSQAVQRTISTNALSTNQSYYIGWILDAAGVVSEASEQNNVTVLVPTRLGVAASTQPDLTTNGNGASFTPSTATTGQLVSVSCTISNIGSASSGGYAVSFYASADTSITSGDQLLGSVSMASLPAGNSANCLLTTGYTTALQAGASYWIGWIVDSASAVAESNESNNISYIAGAQLSIVSSNPGTYTANAISNGFAPQLGTVLFDGNVQTYDDWYSTLSSLPFQIQFYGQSFSGLQVHTNGFITFSSAIPTASQVRDNTALPAQGLPNNLVALFWDDLEVGPGSEINYLVTGAAPNRVLTIEFLGLNPWSLTGSVSGQIRIYEPVGGANSRIDLIYGLASSWTNMACTIGIENSAGTSAVTPVVGSPNISSRPSTGFRFQ